MDDRKAWHLASLLTLVSACVAFGVAVYSLIARALWPSIYLAAATVPYIAAGVAGLRGVFASRPRVIAGLGLLLAVIECANIIGEEFFSLGAPANAIVPASAMAAIILTAAVAAVLSGLRRLEDAIAGSVLAVSVGMMISCAVALVLIASSGRAGSDLPQAMMNATMHLVVPPMVAAVVGALAALSVRVAGGRAGVRISLAGSLIFAVGVALLVRAASLPRPQRPAYVMPGMLLSALGLTLAPCVLARRRLDTN